MSAADGYAPEPIEQPLGRTAREAAFSAEVERNLRRNMVANFTHGIFGMTGFRIIYAPTLIPAYLLLMSGSTLIVGTGQALLQLGLVLTPLISATALEHRDRILPAALRYGALMRGAVLGLALAGFFLGGWPLIIVSLLCLALLGLFNGMQRVAFQMLIGKLIPIDRRGRLQGWRNLLGGALAAGLSFAAGKWLIDANVWGNGFATTFLLAFLLTSVGLVALRFGVREPVSPAVRTAASLRQRLGDIPHLLADHDYRWFVIAQACAMAGGIAAPFYIIIAQQTMTLDGQTIGLLSLAYIGADTLSNLLWGYAGDRFGYRSTMLSALVATLCGFALLASHISPLTTIAAFAAFGVGGAGYSMSSQTMVLEFGLREDLPMRIALSATIEGGISALMPLLGGLALALAGATPLLCAAGALTIGALALISTRVVDPRRRAAPVWDD